MAHVVCPETVTGPAPPAGWPANVPCGCKVPVVSESDVMYMRCPRGHEFYATPGDVVKASVGEAASFGMAADVALQAMRERDAAIRALNTVAKARNEAQVEVERLRRLVAVAASGMTDADLKEIFMATGRPE